MTHECPYNLLRHDFLIIEVVESGLREFIILLATVEGVPSASLIRAISAHYSKGW